MTMFEWLNAHAPGFVHLTPEERRAIGHFTMVWGSLEGVLFQNNATEEKAFDVARDIASKIVLADFEHHLDYFRHRYLRDERAEYYFRTLHLSHTGEPRVLRVLRGEVTYPAEIVGALLLIVYRFRNNLFHGLKWADDIRGQYDNFLHAGDILIQVFALRYP